MLEYLFYKKNKEKVRKHTNQFQKQSNNAYIQNWGSVMGVERENYIFQLGKLFSRFNVSKINFKKFRIKKKIIESNFKSHLIFYFYKN